MTQPRGGYASIDLAKFAASLLVVLLHLGPGLFLLNQFACRLAVPFFLVCAGYFLFRGMPAGLDDGRIRSHLVRVGRLYLLWTAIYYLALLLLTPPYNREEIAFLTRPAEVLWRVLVDGSWSVLWYLVALLWAVALCWGCLRLGLGVRGTVAAGGLFYLVGLLGQAYSPLLAAAPGGAAPFFAFVECLGGSRNGLFFAFFYVALGLALSRAKAQPRARVLAGLAVSLAALLAEVLLVRRLALAAGGQEIVPDFYLFTAPAAWFLVSALLGIRAPGTPAHRLLRAMSTLLYCSHILVWQAVGMLCWLLGVPLGGWALFGAVLALSLAFSLVVALAARKKPLAWLGWLY